MSKKHIFQVPLRENHFIYYFLIISLITKQTLSFLNYCQKKTKEPNL
jgi:hypothetical protein